MRDFAPGAPGKNGVAPGPVGSKKVYVNQWVAFVFRVCSRCSLQIRTTPRSKLHSNASGQTVEYVTTPGCGSSREGVDEGNSHPDSGPVHGSGKWWTVDGGRWT